MNAIPMSSNRHPVDQLALVRETIKNLKEREDELVTAVKVLAGDHPSVGGDEFIASVAEYERAGNIDAAAMKKAGINVDQFRKPATKISQVRITARVREDA